MRSGFSLIELLVVISIIGVLIGLSIFGLQGARQSSRDAKRMADLQQIRSGIEIYRADCGSYPTNAIFSLPSTTSLYGADPSGSCSSSNAYVSSVPQDSLPDQNYSYNSPDSGLTYFLCAALEQTPTTLSGDLPNCASCGGVACNYVVKNP
jgi:general secretion pathway protein G